MVGPTIGGFLCPNYHLACEWQYDGGGEAKHNAHPECISGINKTGHFNAIYILVCLQIVQEYQYSLALAIFIKEL